MRGGEVLLVAVAAFIAGVLLGVIYLAPEKQISFLQDMVNPNSFKEQYDEQKKINAELAVTQAVGQKLLTETRVTLATQKEELAKCYAFEKELLDLSDEEKKKYKEALEAAQKKNAVTHVSSKKVFVYVPKLIKAKESSGKLGVCLDNARYWKLRFERLEDKCLP